MDLFDFYRLVPYYLAIALPPLGIIASVAALIRAKSKSLLAAALVGG